MEIVTQFLSSVLELLPKSPFAQYIDACERLPYLGMLNWFLPVSSMISIGQAWLVSIGLFYICSIVLRWIKVIS